MTDGYYFPSDHWATDYFGEDYWSGLVTPPPVEPASGGGIGGGYGYGPEYTEADNSLARRRKRQAQERAWAAARGRDELIQQAKELVDGPGRRAKAAAEARLAERRAEIKAQGKDEFQIEAMMQACVAQEMDAVRAVMLPLMARIGEQFGIDRETLAALMDLAEAQARAKTKEAFEDDGN